MIFSGIVDNDHKGETGRGTIHWVEVTENGQTTRYEYGLLEVLSGKFDLAALKEKSEKTSHLR